MRITAPVELGQEVLPAVVIEYQKKFPDVQVELLLSDQRVELLAENVDLALRAGQLKDSTLIARKVGEIFFAPYASPKYIKTYGRLSHPRELRQHRCLQFTPLGHESWNLVSSNGRLDIPVTSALIVNDLKIIRSMVMESLGVAMLPNYLCRNDLEKGKIERVLNPWKSDPVPVHFVYPAQKFATPKLTEFLKIAVDKIAQRLR